MDTTLAAAGDVAVVVATGEDSFVDLTSDVSSADVIVVGGGRVDDRRLFRTWRRPPEPPALEEFWRLERLVVVATIVTAGAASVGVAGCGDSRSSVEEDMRFVRFFGGRDLLPAVDLADAVAVVVVVAAAGDPTGDKAGLDVEQLDVVENRLVGVSNIEVGVDDDDIVDRLANELRRLPSESDAELLLLCDFECRMSRFMRPDEKLHKWHLYICCDEEPPPVPPPPPPLLEMPPPLMDGDRVVDAPRIRTSCSLVVTLLRTTIDGDALARMVVV